MKNMILNTINYTGLVTLSKQIGNAKMPIAQIHNAGGTPLFEFIAECLAGNMEIAKAIRPTKVMLLKSNDLTNFEDLSGTFYLITKPEKLTSNSKHGIGARYSFLLPKDLIENITAFDNVYLALYSDATDTTRSQELANYAAICKLEVIKNTIVNAALAVDWDLTVSNYKTTAE